MQLQALLLIISVAFSKAALLPSLKSLKKAILPAVVGTGLMVLL